MPKQIDNFFIVLGTTTLAIKYLVQWGVIKPVPTRAQLLEMYQVKKEGIQNRVEDIQTKVVERKIEIQENIKEKKQILQQSFKEDCQQLKQDYQQLKQDYKQFKHEFKASFSPSESDSPSQKKTKPGAAGERKKQG